MAGNLVGTDDLSSQPSSAVDQVSDLMFKVLRINSFCIPNFKVFDIVCLYFANTLIFTLQAFHISFWLNINHVNYSSNLGIFVKDV